jgi:hypothetical protein
MTGAKSGRGGTAIGLARRPRPQLVVGKRGGKTATSCFSRKRHRCHSVAGLGVAITNLSVVARGARRVAHWPATRVIRGNAPNHSAPPAAT